MLNYKIVENLIEQEDASLTVESLSDRLFEALSDEPNSLPILVWYAKNNIDTPEIFSAVLITLLRKKVTVEEILKSGLLEYFFFYYGVFEDDVYAYDYLIIINDRLLLDNGSDISQIKTALTSLLDYVNTHGIEETGFERRTLNCKYVEYDIPIENKVKIENIITPFAVTETPSNLTKLYSYFQETLLVKLSEERQPVFCRVGRFLKTMLPTFRT